MTQPVIHYDNIVAAGYTPDMWTAVVASDNVILSAISKTIADRNAFYRVLVNRVGTSPCILIIADLANETRSGDIIQLLELCYAVSRGTVDLIGIVEYHTSGAEIGVYTYGVCHSHQLALDRATARLLHSSGRTVNHSADNYSSVIPAHAILGVLYSFQPYISVQMPYSVLMLPISVLSRVRVHEDDSRIQRTFRKSHANNIRDSVLHAYDAHSQIILESVIILGIYNREYHVIDGQHRLAAYTDVYHKIHLDLCIPTQLIHYTSHEQLIESFLRFNKAQPLSDAETKAIAATRHDSDSVSPTASDGALVKVVSTIPSSLKLAAQVVDSISEQWPQLIRGGPTKRPYIHRDELIKDLCKVFANDTNIATRTCDDIIRILHDRNAEIPKNSAQWQTRKGTTLNTKSIETCNRMHCYLGVVDCDKWFIS